MNTPPFSGPVGKDLMVQQGYVPDTCTLDDRIAGALIYSEISAGRSPCWGCHADRSVCEGQPRRLYPKEVVDRESQGPRGWLPAPSTRVDPAPAIENIPFARALRKKT